MGAGEEVVEIAAALDVREEFGEEGEVLSSALSGISHLQLP